MKFIEVDGQFGLYPVGEHIRQAQDFIDKAFDAIKNTFPSRANPDNNMTNVNIWVMGSSGAILGTMLAMQFPKDKYRVSVNHIKKKGESAHAARIGSGLRSAVDIVIDDFISTGATLNNIADALETRNIHSVDYLILGDPGDLCPKFKPRLVAAFLVSCQVNTDWLT